MGLLLPKWSWHTIGPGGNPTKRQRASSPKAVGGLRHRANSANVDNEWYLIDRKHILFFKWIIWRETYGHTVRSLGVGMELQSWQRCIQQPQIGLPQLSHVGGRTSWGKTPCDPHPPATNRDDDSSLLRGKLYPAKLRISTFLERSPGG